MSSIKNIISQLSNLNKKLEAHKSRNPKEFYQSKYAINREMDQYTYKLRRQVIKYIYEAKNLLKSVGINMPRVEVRITDTKEGHKNVLGSGRYGDNIIWIPAWTVENIKQLRKIVFHELAHTLWSQGHENNALMKPYHDDDKIIPDSVIDSLFLKYAKNHNK